MRTEYVVHRRLRFEPTKHHDTIEPGDQITHDGVAERMTVYRTGQIVRTMPLSCVAVGSFMRTGILQAISPEPGQSPVLTSVKIDIIPAAEAPEALNESRGRNPLWDEIAEALQDAKRGSWLRVSPDDVPGKDVVNKQANIGAAMKKRHLKITCRVHEGRIWFRVRTEEPKK